MASILTPVNVPPAILASFANKTSTNVPPDHQFVRTVPRVPTALEGFLVYVSMVGRDRTALLTSMTARERLALTVLRVLIEWGVFIANAPLEKQVSKQYFVYFCDENIVEKLDNSWFKYCSHQETASFSRHRVFSLFFENNLKNQSINLDGIKHVLLQF